MQQLLTNGNGRFLSSQFGVRQAPFIIHEADQWSCKTKQKPQALLDYSSTSENAYTDIYLQFFLFFTRFCNPFLFSGTNHDFTKRIIPTHVSSVS